MDTHLVTSCVIGQDTGQDTVPGLAWRHKPGTRVKCVKIGHTQTEAAKLEGQWATQQLLGT